MTGIVHVVAWRLNGTTPAERQRQAQTAVAAVQALRDQIPGLLALNAGANLVEAADAWDVGTVMTFASRADLDAYQTHPAHLALKSTIGPLRSARCQFDIALNQQPMAERLRSGHPQLGPFAASRSAIHKG